MTCSECLGLSHAWSRPTREPVELPDHHYILLSYACNCDCGCIASMSMVDAWPIEEENTISFPGEIIDQFLPD